MKKLFLLIALVLLAACSGPTQPEEPQQSQEPPSSSAAYQVQLSSMTQYLPSSATVVPASSAAPQIISLADYDIPRQTLDMVNVGRTHTKSIQCEPAESGGGSVCYTYLDGVLINGMATEVNGGVTLLMDFYYEIYMYYPIPYRVINNTVTLGAPYQNQSNIEVYDFSDVLLGYATQSETVVVSRSSYGSYTDCIQIDINGSTYAEGNTQGYQTQTTMCRGVGTVRVSDANDTWVLP